MLRRLGRTVAALRTEAGRTQEELAHEAGLTSRFLQMVERGSANPSYLRMRALAAALRIGLPDLIERAEKSP